jgi:hypothetical protein
MLPAAGRAAAGPGDQQAARAGRARLRGRAAGGADVHAHAGRLGSRRGRLGLHGCRRAVHRGGPRRGRRRHRHRHAGAVRSLRVRRAALRRRLHARAPARQQPARVAPRPFTAHDSDKPAGRPRSDACQPPTQRSPMQAQCPIAIGSSPSGGRGRAARAGARGALGRRQGHVEQQRRDVLLGHVDIHARRGGVALAVAACVLGRQAERARHRRARPARPAGRSKRAAALLSRAGPRRRCRPKGAGAHAFSATQPDSHAMPAHTDMHQTPPVG